MDEVIEGGQTMNPSTEDILNAVDKINAEHIFILPNNKNIILAAEQAAKLSEEKKLHVIPSRSVPEGISAMFCYEHDADPDEMEAAMKDAIQQVDTATVTFAVRDTSIGDKQIKEGNILGMLNDEIEVVAEDVMEARRSFAQCHHRGKRGCQHLLRRGHSRGGREGIVRLYRGRISIAR